MVWIESKDDENYEVPRDVVDYAFRIQCKQLPLDHAHSLSKAVLAEVPWLADLDRAGIHLIHVAESGNGWMRPEDNENEVLCVSKRTRFHIRVPQEHVEKLQDLEGKMLDIEGNTLVLGKGQIKPFVVSSTLFSRYVPTDPKETEAQFIERQVAALQAMNIHVKKLLCGRTNHFRFPEREYHTRSIMLADLDRDDSVYLQQEGLGDLQKVGFGLFIPHKGIAPVVSKE